MLPNGPRVRASLAALLLLAAPALSARQGDPVPAPTRTIRFIVRVAPEDLVLATTPIPGEQASLTSVSLRPEAGAARFPNDPGRPQLPFVLRSIAVPPGAKLLGVTAVALKSVVAQSGVTLVEWAQPARPTQNLDPPLPVYENGADPFYPAARTISLDPGVLQAPRWPLDMVGLDGAAEALGWQLTNLRVAPVQWLPSTQELVLHTEIEVVVSWQGGTLPQAEAGYGQALQLAELRSRVVNPEDLPAIPVPLEPLSGDVWYLIITDNFQWNDDITIGRSAGDLVGEFSRLARWKNEKGIKAGVVTISDIVRGVYGDFTTGARDLQEVLRNFLKFASREWHTYWVLLGGDVQIVPARFVPGVAGAEGVPHYFAQAPQAAPEPGYAFWDEDSATLRLHLHPPSSSFTWLGVILDPETGLAYERTPAPAPETPGWTYVTGADYATPSDVPTAFVSLRGPVEEVRRMAAVLVTQRNLIPTDLYYASLQASFYDRPGLHDWDANDNLLYGQHTSEGASLDGVNFFANVSVGRAPARTATSARAFVDKVLAYERYGHPDGSAWTGFGPTVTFAESNWTWWLVEAAVEACSGPPTRRGQACVSAGTALAWLDRGVPREPSHELVVETSSTRRKPRYDPDARPGSSVEAWHYCTDAACSGVSESWLAGRPVPLPTAWVRLVGISSPVSRLLVQPPGGDTALVEKEAIRRLLGLLAPGLTTQSRLYQDIANTPPAPATSTARLSEAEMALEISAGRNIVTLSGHGEPSGCCGVSAGGTYTNGLRGGMVFADSCLTNAFDENVAVSEKLVTSTAGGFAAYVGNTRYGWIGVGDDIERLFWWRLMSTRHIGALMHARFDIGRGSRGVWSVFTQNLVGDPEMSLWLGEPSALAVDHPATVYRSSRFDARVTRPDGSPVEGARVVLAKDDTQLATALTDADGRARVQASDRAGDVLRITVMNPGDVPYQGDIAVIAPPGVAVSLLTGGNLVSTPVRIDDPALDRVLAPIAGAVARVTSWDPASGRPLLWVPGGMNNTLSSLDPGRAYDIEMRAPGVVALDGTPVRDPIGLRFGLNMVGFSSLARMPVSDALKSISGAFAAVYTWDASAGRFLWYYPAWPRLSTLKYLDPGRGYVIMATKPAIWTLPAAPPK